MREHSFHSTQRKYSKNKSKMKVKITHSPSTQRRWSKEKVKKRKVKKLHSPCAFASSMAFSSFFVFFFPERSAEQCTNPFASDHTNGAEVSEEGEERERQVWLVSHRELWIGWINECRNGYYERSITVQTFITCIQREKGYRSFLRQRQLKVLNQS